MTNTDIKKLTLEEMLALAKKVKWWERKADESEYSSTYTKEGQHKGIKISVSIKSGPFAWSGEAGIRADYNGVMMGISNGRKEADVAKVCDCFENISCREKYADRDYWAKVEEQYFQEAKQLAREAMEK